jgi:hypothetical protein
VEQSRRLTTLLRFVVCEEDHLEADSITCHLPIEIRQGVVADDVKLRHANCPSESAIAANDQNRVINSRISLKMCKNWAIRGGEVCHPK